MQQLSGLLHPRLLARQVLMHRLLQAPVQLSRGQLLALQLSGRVALAQALLVFGQAFAGLLQAMIKCSAQTQLQLIQSLALSL